jgi:multiple sugar transport system ATP-binding protein
MTVEDNLGYGLRKSTALSDTEIQAQITEIAELMGIGDHLSKKPGQLSGGQKQRVATGRALVRDPAVFLLDEPLSNLDAELRLHMRTEIQRIQSEFGTTTVYVTHDQEEAMTMGDRIAVMRDGQIEQIGRPSDIYDHPRTQFVARFVGNPSMNFFQGRLADGLVETPAFAVDISDLPDRPASREYIVGVRPEAIDIASGRSGGSATVTVVEPTGSEAIVYLEVDDTELTVKTARENAPEPEDHVAVEVPAHGVYLFDSETGSTVLGGPQPSTVVRQ